jgi:hypothetical protein
MIKIVRNVHLSDTYILLVVNKYWIIEYVAHSLEDKFREEDFNTN